jgi:hypothetical protein
MSAVKKIGVIAGVGVIIAVAYYFLTKSKPKVTEEQIAELNTDEVSLIEEQLVAPPTIEQQLQIDRCQGLTRTECERLYANIDRETALANGTPIVSTYNSGGSSPRISTSNTREGISYSTPIQPTGGTTSTGATTVQVPTAGTTSSGTSNIRPTRGSSSTPTRGSSSTPIRVYQSGGRG